MMTALAFGALALVGAILGFNAVLIAMLLVRYAAELIRHRLRDTSQRPSPATGAQIIGLHPRTGSH